mgnify:CR=1 FL=1
MNAAECAKTIALASRIAGTVNLFKIQFPDVRTDLKPWLNDADTRDLIDPESIDLGFHFPGYSRACACRSILVQIRLFHDPYHDGFSDRTKAEAIDLNPRVIGLDLAGYDHRGQQWRLSTIESWQFVGETTPRSEPAEKLKHFSRDVFQLFNDPGTTAAIA